MSAEERFWAKVDKSGGECWIWTASVTSRGLYGCFHTGSRARGTKKIVRAHRFSYELVNGRVPEGLELDHLCRNRLCVNPAHLEAVTHRENVLRGYAARRAEQAA